MLSNRSHNCASKWLNKSNQYEVSNSKINQINAFRNLLMNQVGRRALRIENLNVKNKNAASHDVNSVYYT
jgi:hypothetical protein